MGQVNHEHRARPYKGDRAHVIPEAVPVGANHCPFCMTRNVEICSTNGTAAAREFWVRCPRCHATGPHHWKTTPTPGEAVLAWNAQLIAVLRITKTEVAVDV